MTDSEYIYESGTAVVVGRHGQHDYVFASGTEFTDEGNSTLVFESGTGIGGTGGLIHHYPFDETSGTVAQDVVGGNDGQIGDDVILGQPGKDGTSFEFDPSTIDDDYVDVRDQDFSPAEFTVAIWVNVDVKSEPDRPSVNDTPIQQFFETENNIELYTNDDTQNFLWNVDNSQSGGNLGGTVTSSAIYGSWVHLIGTFDEQTLTLYVNGSPVGSYTASETFDPLNQGAGYIFGREYSDSENNQRVNGRLDDARLYRKALNDQEASDLYNSY